MAFILELLFKVSSRIPCRWWHWTTGCVTADLVKHLKLICVFCGLLQIEAKVTQEPGLVTEKGKGTLGSNLGAQLIAEVFE